jgi:hypothetical protein
LLNPLSANPFLIIIGTRQRHDVARRRVLEWADAVIAVTDQQLALVMTAASALPVEKRVAFLL